MPGMQLVGQSEQTALVRGARQGRASFGAEAQVVLGVCRNDQSGVLKPVDAPRLSNRKLPPLGHSTAVAGG